MLKTEKSYPRASLVLGMSMFVMGGCGLAYEYTFSRIASDLMGNSSRQWAIIIAVMMFFMGIGSDIQKYLKDQYLIDKLVFSEIALGLCGGFGPILMLYAYGHFYSYYILVQYFFIGMVGLLIGFEIPLLTRINQAYEKDLQFNLGAILKMDYIGSLVFALLWIFLLPKFFTIIETAFVLSMMTIIAAMVTFIYFRDCSLRKKSLQLSLVIAFVLAIVSFSQTKDWTLQAEQFLYQDRIIFSTTTQYQHIVLTKGTTGEVSCYINGHLQFNSTDEAIYHENLVHPAMKLAPRHQNVLILGGGDGLALREVLKYPDVQQVYLVDLDPEMTRLASDNPHLAGLNNNSLKDAKTKIMFNHALIDAGQEKVMTLDQHGWYEKRAGEVAEVTIINVDAAKFIEQIPGRFDVIILDFPDPNALELSKLYCCQFYGFLQKKLASGGIFVQQSTSPVHAKEAFLCIGRTMQAAGFTVIPYHDNVPSFGEWGWWIGGRKNEYTEEKIKSRLMSTKKLPVTTKYLTPALISSSLAFGKGMLVSENDNINLINSPQIFDYYVNAWQNN